MSAHFLDGSEPGVEGLRELVQRALALEGRAAGSGVITLLNGRVRSTSSLAISARASWKSSVAETMTSSMLKPAIAWISVYTSMTFPIHVQFVQLRCGWQLPMLAL